MPVAQVYRPSTEVYGLIETWTLLKSQGHENYLLGTESFLLKESCDAWLVSVPILPVPPLPMIDVSLFVPVLASMEAESEPVLPSPDV